MPCRMAASSTVLPFSTETALDLSEDRATGSDVRAILDAVKTMLAADVELLSDTADTIPALAGRYPLMVVTKGDLRDQQAKMYRSGLSMHFRHVEVVSEKNPDSYAALLSRHRIAPDRFLMVGNSLKSDILPVIALGGTAVFVPHPLTWAYEAAEVPADTPGFYEIERLADLPGLLDAIDR